MMAADHIVRFDSFADIDAFVAATRTAVFVRAVDQLLLIRPEKTLGVNETATAILTALYDRGSRGSESALAAVARRYRIAVERVRADASELLGTIRAMMRDDFADHPHVRRVGFDRKRIRFPVMAEIALTYRCQNRCAFCYAASPTRTDEARPMSTRQVRRIMDRIFHEAHVPSLSFTGGESTLRTDLCELVAYGATLGFRMNLITNGVRLADADYLGRLVGAGLASAQVSLEADHAALHDAIVGRPGAFAATVRGVENLHAAGLHVHTNTTLCRSNLDRAPDVIRFVARSLGLRTLSMNFLIRTGSGLTDEAPVTYAEVAALLPGLVETARDEHIKYVWYSPLPYCLLNPVLIGQGAKSCACVSGILSVSPTGQLLPCSSFQQGLGSLLERSYEELLESPAARYWREREYLPPPCHGCADVDVCGGGCPLYWDAVGSFREIPRTEGQSSELAARWRHARHRGLSFGVPRPLEMADQGGA
ncbi:MAG: radical SAM protein [Polyangiaceae bacterium]|nr:radical SAM protein [Polyangiaceae bacterium]